MGVYDKRKLLAVRINCLNQGGGGLLYQIDFCDQICFKIFLTYLSVPILNIYKE